MKMPWQKDEKEMEQERAISLDQRILGVCQLGLEVQGTWEVVDGVETPLVRWPDLEKILVPYIHEAGLMYEISLSEILRNDEDSSRKGSYSALYDLVITCPATNEKKVLSEHGASTNVLEHRVTAAKTNALKHGLLRLFAVKMLQPDFEELLMRCQSPEEVMTLRSNHIPKEEWDDPEINAMIYSRINKLKEGK